MPCSYDCVAVVAVNRSEAESIRCRIEEVHCTRCSGPGRRRFLAGAPYRQATSEWPPTGRNPEFKLFDAQKLTSQMLVILVQLDDKAITIDMERPDLIGAHVVDSQASFDVMCHDIFLRIHGVGAKIRYV